MSNKLKNLLGFENLEGFLFEIEDAKRKKEKLEQVFDCVAFFFEFFLSGVHAFTAEIADF